MKQLIILGLLASFFAWGCDDGNNNPEPYTVNIDIQSPADGAIVNAGEPLDVKVVYSREPGKTIHIVEVHVLDNKDNILAILIDEHAHIESEYVFENTDFVPDTPGSYQIKAWSTDDADRWPNVKEVSFTVVQ